MGRVRGVGGIWLASVLWLAGCAAGRPVFKPGPDGRPAPPIILDPKPDAVITDVRPTITLAIPPVNGYLARIELCGDPKCTKVIHSAKGTGDHVSVTRDLETGVYYLRARGRI